MAEGAGSRAWVPGAALLVMLLLALAGAGTASAAQRPNPGGLVELRTERFSTGGYQVLLTADRYDRRAGADGVSLIIRRDLRKQGHGRRIRASYTPLRQRPVDVSSRHIRARLGSRGAVSMRFRRLSRQVSHVGCLRKVVSEGVLVGRFRFRGESGYLRVDEQRIPARRVRWTRGVCAGASDRPGPRPVLLGACRRGSIFAARRMPDGRTDFVALLFGRDRGLLTMTGAILSAKEWQFIPSHDLDSATLDPSRPFRGRATFRGKDGEGTLTGDLRAQFFATDRIRFTPAPATLARRRTIDCGSAPLSRSAADARADGLRLLGAGWLAGTPTA